MINVAKPLGSKAYGSIPHLPDSRRGPADCGVSPGQAAICIHRPRDKHDRIIVQEKLDGSCVAVANIDGAIVPLIRAGYPAISSKYEQHRLFAAWVFERQDLFGGLLANGERIAGEWLAQAHSTKYDLAGRSPFVAFDLIRGPKRANYDEFSGRAMDAGLTIPCLLHSGGSCTIDWAMSHLDPKHHGAIDPIEGCVWRVERKGVVDFLAKFVRADKVDGVYLPEISGGDPVWNWRP